MKKLYTAGTLFFCILLFGCSKDFLKSYDRRIVGTWRITEIKQVFGGSTDNLAFKDGVFTFENNGSLSYTSPSGSIYQGHWDIQRMNNDEHQSKTLQITVVDFSNQDVLGEFYDQIQFVGTNHFKANIQSGLRNYITHFRR